MGWIILIVLVLLVLIVVGMYNGLVRLRAACESAWADIDATQTPLRPDPEPRRNRQGLRRA